MTLTRSFRRAVVGCLLGMVGLVETEKVYQELKPHRIKSDHVYLQTVINSLKETSLKPSKIACLAFTASQVAALHLRGYLPAVFDKENQWCQEFVTECQTNPRRFEKAITRCKVTNFKNDALKTKIERKNQKIREVRCSRDIVNRLLFLAASVELAGLPAPPTCHTLHLYPFHPSPTFPLSKLYCWKLRNSPWPLVSP